MPAPANQQQLKPYVSTDDSNQVILALRAVGAILILLGFLFLSYDGYVEDAGMTPATTWPDAFVILGAAAVLFVLADRVRPEEDRPPNVIEQATGHGNLFLGLTLLATVVGLKVSTSPRQMTCG